MTTWFIRLGSNSDQADKRLYQDLAERYSLIMIGYGIADDITGLRSFDEIKKYLESKGEKGQSLATRAGLINAFINRTGDKDTVICPFDGGYIRIGKVISECDTLESFFKSKGKDFKAFIGRYDGIQPNPNVKPAIKVKWISEKKPVREFPVELQEALAKPLRKTIQDLKFEEFIDLPEDPSTPEGIAAKSLVEIQKAKAEAKIDNRNLQWTAVALTLVGAAITGIASSVATALTNFWLGII